MAPSPRQTVVLPLLCKCALGEWNNMKIDNKRWVMRIDQNAVHAENFASICRGFQQHNTPLSQKFHANIVMDWLGQHYALMSKSSPSTIP